VTDVRAMQDRGDRAVYLDVREPAEWATGRLPQATLVPRGTLESAVEQRIPREATVILYCARGNRSALAAVTMQQMGYTDVRSMAGGIGAWIEAGGPIER
jgi:sulfur-carrier protein adenylyltransferase/sulfurtransferase